MATNHLGHFLLALLLLPSLQRTAKQVRCAWCPLALIVPFVWRLECALSIPCALLNAGYMLSGTLTSRYYYIFLEMLA